MLSFSFSSLRQGLLFIYGERCHALFRLSMLTSHACCISHSGFVPPDYLWHGSYEWKDVSRTEFKFIAAINDWSAAQSPDNQNYNLVDWGGIGAYQIYFNDQEMTFSLKQTIDTVQEDGVTSLTSGMCFHLREGGEHMSMSCVECAASMCAYVSTCSCFLCFVCVSFVHFAVYELSRNLARCPSIAICALSFILHSHCTDHDHQRAAACVCCVGRLLFHILSALYQPC